MVQPIPKTAQKTYLTQCSFCNGQIMGQQKDKGVKNRNQVRFWSGKVSEERLVCNKCLRENREFLGLVAEEFKGRWRVYKSKGVIIWLKKNYLWLLYKLAKILPEQMRVVDKSRIKKYLGKVSWAVLEEVEKAIHIVLDWRTFLFI